MKSGVCPKCGSHEIYVGKKHKGGYGANTIPEGGFWSLRMYTLDNYVCVECGYVENYISDEKSLRRIAQKWPRVDGRKKKNDEW